MKRWQTKIVVLEGIYGRRAQMKDFEARLNALGAAGWEVAGIDSPTNSANLVVVLKRPEP